MDDDRLPGDRYGIGLRKLREINGEEGVRIVEELGRTSPDMSRFIIEFAYGEVLSRPGLDARTREIATVAALAALGNAPSQLRVHIKGAMNAGCSREEITELMLQMAVYAGFPAALNGLAAAKEVFDGCEGE